MDEVLRLFDSSIIFFENKVSITSFIKNVSSKLCVIADKTVMEFYGDFINSLEADCLIALKGEDSKNLERILPIYENLIAHCVDKTWFVLGVGGGMVCDVTGFVASTYMRGLHFGFVPTTLLSMVDAAIGGKNGLNLKVYKNIIGTINLPDFVCVCPEFLTTLPPDEFRNGMAEVIKAGAIKDRFLFEILESEENIHNKLPEIVKLSIRRKIEVVRNDLKDSNIRKVLNFGHTVGHAIELTLNLKHGFAVSIGMVLETIVGILLFGVEEGVALRIVGLLRKFGLPTCVDLDGFEEEIFKVILHDKKSQDENIELVCVREIGSSELISVEKSKLLEGLRWAFKRQVDLKKLSAQV